MASTAMTPNKLFDVLIIGGGPAGLSIATSLARQAHTALVLDSGAYRNAAARHMHNVPGFDHVDPAEFRAKVREDLRARYASVEFRSATVRQVRRLEGVFEAVDEEGTVYRGRKLGLATGVRDKLEEEVPGYAECWGRGVFHCLFCHGFEERGVESAGLLAGGMPATPEIMAHVARMAKRLSKRVTIYTNTKHGDLLPAVKALLHSSRITIDTRPIKSLALVGHGPQVQITFADGSTATEGFIASHPGVEQRGGDLAAQLGLEMTPMGDVKVSPPFNETSVAGCFAAGDAAVAMKSVVSALHTGTFAGTGVIAQLQRELDEADEL